MNEKKYRYYKFPRLHIFAVVGDGCVEIIFCSFRVYLFSFAFAVISRHFYFDWNVYRKFWFSFWETK